MEEYWADKDVTQIVLNRLGRMAVEDSTRSCGTVVWETGRVVAVGDGAEGTSLGREIHKTWSWTNCWPRQQGRAGGGAS